MDTKKIKFQEEAISEILVADTDSETGAEASNVKDDFEEEEEKQQQQKQASAEVKPQAATSGRLPSWGPPQRRNTNIHRFVGPAKDVKKSEAQHINKDGSPLYVLSVDVSHKNFSFAGGRDQHIQPAILRRTSWT